MRVKKRIRKGPQAGGKAPLLPVVIGTGFGSGFWPWGPGTAGAALAVLIWLALSCAVTPQVLVFITMALTVVFTLLGVWAADRLEPYWGEDPSRVVVDEMVGVWIPLLVASPDIWWTPWAAFLLFRFFDILKPLGIRRMEALPGGVGVMMDDILAGVYSAAVMILIHLLCNSI